MSIADELRLDANDAVGVDGRRHVSLARAGLSSGSWRALRHLYRGAAVALDTVVVVSFVGYVASRFEAPLAAAAAAVSAVLFVGTVALVRGYDTRRMANGVEEYTALLKAGGVLVAAFVLAGFFELAMLPPGIVLVSASAVVITAVLLRAALRGLLGLARSRGLVLARTVVVGGQSVVTDTVRLLEDPRQGHRVIGACVAEGTQMATQVPTLGAPADLSAVAREHDVDSIVIDPNVMSADEFRKFRWSMEHLDVEVLATTDLTELLASRVSMRVLNTTPMLSLQTRPSRVQRIVKTVADRVLAAIGLILVSPILLGAGLAVRLTSPGAAIFRQIRIGAGGAPFTMLKFRTMTVDAEARKSEVDNADGAGPLFKSRQDPRITPLGRVLRRYSIDELPQLWNVVRGDMSLVGPRPPLPTEVAVYDSMAVHRLNVKPGLTGLWQVSGRSDLNWEQSVRLDLLYVDNWSLFLDMKILWKTLRAVLGSEGAY